MNTIEGYDYTDTNGIVTLYIPKTQGVYTTSVQRAVRALATLGLYQSINVVKCKTKTCRRVCQLMDEGASYQDALRVVMDFNPRVDKKRLENELVFYIG